ncbi:MAG: GNAT family N-acetyltransferase [Candidatus Lokiarchaeota archaeon]|nr:GNAT family N-acetyltransferase [Candidatus Lokiarchaeota archaeon]MBD3200012.1 GNAT family N-acetyltransferase [Candidatus Lokiarchaeota archaeon]
MIITKVHKKDIKKIYKLEKKVFCENAFTQEIISQLVSDHLVFWKMVMEGFFKKIIGFIILIKDRKDRANLINFLINPKYQGKGYGTLLLRKTLKHTRANFQEIVKIVLNVNVDNHFAIKIYKNHDFTIVKRIKNYYRTGDNAYLMELNI